MFSRHSARNAALLVLAGCAHATTTTQPTQPHSHTATPAAKAEQAPEPPAATLGPAKPSGLGLPAVLQKDAVAKIQEALTKHGYPTKASATIDHATQEKLRQFQEKEGLARTGMPDQLTLTKLGLDPKEILQMDDEGRKGRE
jgi:hypothetical protein